MKYVKIIGLLAVATAALMVFAGSASADTFTSPTGTVYTGEIVADAEGHAVLDNPIAKIECASSVKGKVEEHGAGKVVKGNISALSFTGCTNQWHVTVVAAGTLSVNNEGASTSVFSSGATVEATRFGVTCRYATNNTKVGGWTNSATDSSHATIHITASVPLHSGSFLCGEGATTWTGGYTVIQPVPLIVHNT